MTLTTEQRLEIAEQKLLNLKKKQAEYTLKAYNRKYKDIENKDKSEENIKLRRTYQNNYYSNNKDKIKKKQLEYRRKKRTEMILKRKQQKKEQQEAGEV